MRESQRLRAVQSPIYTGAAKAVSDLILAEPAVSAVLLVGDTCNASKTPIAEYRKLYQGTYDRFLAKIHPCPGNHDEHDTPPFSGYREFWGRRRTRRRCIADFFRDCARKEWRAAARRQEPHH
jgi:hypothetical protein